MNKVSLAAMFRHDPENDGSTIPASLERQDPTCEWETVVDPIVGFMAVSYMGRVSWCFVKYEAPDIRYLKKDDKSPRIRLASMSTSRVGHVTCPQCGNACVYPVWSKTENMPCPACGHKGVEADLIREGGSEFMSLMGDLKDQLEEAVLGVDQDTADEFRFPDLMLLGHVDPSPSVDPALQGLATSRGLGLKLARESSSQELFGTGMQGPDTGLLIRPGVVSGVLDADDARDGWRRTEGVVTSFVKLGWLPKEPARPARFGGARL